jgi:aspartate/methionine/tyrosine aminotransferase
VSKPRTLRFAHIEPLDIIAVAEAAEVLGSSVLRLENLDTDIAPPSVAFDATRDALDDLTSSSSYLPFTGKAALRAAVAEQVHARTGRSYDPDTEVVISSGGLAALFAALLALVDAGDHVVLTDPCYAGFIARVRLAGAEPIHVPLRADTGRWRLDVEALDRVEQAKVIITMSPSMPTGHVLNNEEWDAVARLVQRTGAWVLHDTAMERLTFDARPISSPLYWPTLAERTILVGSASKEYRMIGWRTGWALGPAEVMRDVGSAVVYSTVAPSGFNQAGVLAALRAACDGITEATCEWQTRRDFILAELAGLPVISPDGGWSLLLDATALGTSAPDLSRRLLTHGRIAATPLTSWGPSVAPGHVRLVYAREPLHRMKDLRRRVDAAIHTSAG